MKERVYSIPALKRMPAYLKELKRARADKVPRIASAQLAKRLNIDSITVRIDLEMIGAAGAPGIGYRVDALTEHIEAFLGWNNSSEAFLIGVGELGRALLGYSGFSAYGLKIIAAFNCDEAISSYEEYIHGIPVFPITSLEHLIKRLKIKLAILCVDDAYAQNAAETAVNAGIMAIWNFTQQSLLLPERVIQQQANFGGDFAVLSVKLAERIREDEQYGF